MFAEDEARLILRTAESPGEVTAMVDRRVTGVPIEQVVGWAEFCGLRIELEPGVFVPRRRSEFLARQAVEALAGAPHRPAVVVDLCCGSGAIGAAIRSAVELVTETLVRSLDSRSDGEPTGAMTAAVQVHAADLDPAAVRCARRNLPGGRVHEGDLYDALPAELRGRVDVIVVSPPYVPTGDIGLLPAEARDHEPRTALDGGGDGLDVFRRIAAAASDWLAPGGRLLAEMSLRQLDAAKASMAEHGLDVQVRLCDDLDATVVIGEVIE